MIGNNALEKDVSLKENIELEEIIHNIRKFIFENYLFGYKENELTNDMSFLGYGVIDSLGVVELLTYIEKEFNITVSNDEILPDNLDSVDCVSRFILRKAMMKRG